MINIVIPMAGFGQRFVDAGYSTPKPFIKIDNKMMIERVLESFSQLEAKINIIIRDTLLDQCLSEINYLKNKYANLSFSILQNPTLGASCTVLSLHRYINTEEPLLIADCDNIFDASELKSCLSSLKTSNYDAGLVVFESCDPKYSYVKLENDLVVQTKEKEVISNLAITGLYYFQKGKYFVENCIDMIVENKSQKGEFYVSGVYNNLISNSYKVGAVTIDNSKWYCVGTPEDLKTKYSAEIKAL